MIEATRLRTYAIVSMGHVQGRADSRARWTYFDLGKPGRVMAVAMCSVQGPEDSTSRLPVVGLGVRRALDVTPGPGCHLEQMPFKAS